LRRSVHTVIEGQLLSLSSVVNRILKQKVGRAITDDSAARGRPVTSIGRNVCALTWPWFTSFQCFVRCLALVLAIGIVGDRMPSSVRSGGTWNGEAPERANSRIRACSPGQADCPHIQQLRGFRGGTIICHCMNRLVAVNYWFPLRIPVPGGPTGRFYKQFAIMGPFPASPP